ncbi:coiled-coil and C2 domain-containing protein 1B [Dunckerocampus dactyliophorus]|uniref:coiled-coil and C2 domain-containing protein 1B n=1 Tax=Dunckerocampus dactyliophorus TaxID=161453 RepID=UPI0024076EA1|nr:coiled-coil and C2 domain-containing protein 1B [Dunckerocampus dactyliophorus]XP_054611600.1 coiled-coil and C2 domain-containing protein 1B [Dunckerocampus dactyliophorus]
MFGKKRREPLPKCRGASTAKQMGLFLDLDPEEMIDAEENLDDPDLEAELAALTGGKAAANAEGGARHKGKSPLPMEDITRMAEACMRDVDEDEDDDDVEDDEDLLAELQEVVGESEEAVIVSSSSAAASAATKLQPSPPSQQTKVPSAAPGNVQHTLEERLVMYTMALDNAKIAGESAKARRLERGLKTLETMLGSVKKGRQVSEAQIPPPVATGASSSATLPPQQPALPIPSPLKPAEQAVECEATTPEIVTPASKEEQHSSASAPVTLSEPTEPSQERASPLQDNETNGQFVLTMLQERQREYKMAALRAKKDGEVEQAMLYFKTSKGFNGMIDALKRGQAVDLSSLPSLPPGSGGSPTGSVKQNTPVAPPAEAAPAPQAPKDVMEALEQRRAKYMEASAQAKASGDERKARMHDRIAKQYQSAIRSHKAGKMINFDELPVPPGFPPIPGQKSTTAEQGLVAALEAATKIASTDDDAASEDEEEEEKEKESKRAEEPKKSTLSVPASSQGRRRSPSRSPERPSTRELSAADAEQLEFLEGRRRQYMKAALHAKQKNDVEQARSFLRTAKGLEPMIEAVRGGQAVDMSTVPSPPGDEDEDFVLVHHSDVNLSEKAEQVYIQLAKILKEQHEKCLSHSKQFTHLGNVAETTKFEKMAEFCKKSMEILKLSQAQGLPPPKHHFEDRTFHMVRMFPDLSSTEMVVVIVKGMNLPAPSGIQTGDLDAYVKFDFPYPSTEQPQRHKTSVIKNTNCPEYNQSFTLTINRNHRGFRRVVTSKGLKMELLHKGGFLRSDKPIGTAHVRMDKLESHSEIREIVEVMDGRKPTGGRLEVRVRLREPLNGQDMQASTERWLVIEQPQVLL